MTERRGKLQDKQLQNSYFVPNIGDQIKGDMGGFMYIRGPFENFVDWRHCAAVMQREAGQRSSGVIFISATVAKVCVTVVLK
jgi:hypothetical protein